MGHRYTLPAGKPPLALACAAALTAAFTAGCAGPRTGIPPTADLTRFHQIPSSPATGYAIIQGVVTANGSLDFTIPARDGYIVWLGCLGGDGKAHIASPQLMPAGWGMPCDSTGTVTAFNFNLTRAPAQEEITLSVTAPLDATWEMRVDARSGGR